MHRRLMLELNQMSSLLLIQHYWIKYFHQAHHTDFNQSRKRFHWKYFSEKETNIIENWIVESLTKVMDFFINVQHM